MLETIQNYHCPRWAELPGIPLYLDQMVMVIEDAIGIFTAEDEAAITKTMINNYVKQKLVSPPEGKKYGRAQMAQLIQLGMLKRVFSMSEISALLREATTQYGEEQAYDMFCERFEALLAGAFEQDAFSARAKKMADKAGGVLDIALLALVSKLRVQSELPKQEAVKAKPAKKAKAQAKPQ